MKTKLILLFLLSGLFLTGYSQTRIDKPYDFPIKPGTPEWELLNTGQEMVDVCQIPEDILKSLTTKALAETCLKYPLEINYLAANNERDGIAYMISEFNGLQELSGRSDGPEVLIEVYRNFPVYNSKSELNESQIRNIYKLPFIELILADDRFANQLSDKENVELIEIVQNKYEEKVNNLTIYSLNNIRKSLLLGAVSLNKRTTLRLSLQDQGNVKSFIDSYPNIEAETFTEVTKILSKQ